MLSADRRSPEGLQNCGGFLAPDATAVDSRVPPQLQETRALRARRARCRLKSEFRLKPFRISVGTPSFFLHLVTLRTTSPRFFQLLGGALRDRLLQQADRAILHRGRQVHVTLRGL